MNMKQLVSVGVFGLLGFAAESEACRCIRFIPFAENVQSSFENSPRSSHLVLGKVEKYSYPQDPIQSHSVYFSLTGVLRGDLDSMPREIELKGFRNNSCSAMATSLEIGKSYVVLLSQAEDGTLSFNGYACAAGAVQLAE